MLTQGEVEEEIIRLSRLLEERTHEYADQCLAEAEGEMKYKERHHILMIHEANRPTPGSARDRDARVAMACKDEFAVYRIAEARRTATKELLVSLRHQIDALRTISANIRAQT